MLQLFKSIFSTDTEKGKYPEALITEAIERAVDGTDPSLRALMRYRSKLRPLVIRSIDHVVELVDALPEPIELSKDSLSNSPLLKTFFISAEHLQKIISNDAALKLYLEETKNQADRVYALLVMERQERQTFGADLVGETLVRDVAQTTISFTAHRLLDPNTTVAKTRRQLKRRAFDHLLSMALSRISNLSDLRSGLQKRRDMLQAKLNLLQRGNWGFEFRGSRGQADAREIEKELKQIEEGLLNIGTDNDYLEVHMKLLGEVLGKPEHYLNAEKSTVIMDRMGIKRKEPSKDAPEVEMQELYNADGRRVTVSMVRLAMEPVS